MSFQRVPDTAEVRCIMDYLDQEFVSTFYARSTVAYGTGDLNDLMGRVGDAFRDELMDHVTDMVTFDRVEVRDLNTEFGYSAVQEYNTPGLQTGDMVAPQVCVLMKYTGDPGGAPRQGHLFISGCDIARYNAETGLWDQTLIDEFVAVLESIRDAIADDGPGTAFAQVIVSRRHNNALRSEAVTNTLNAITGRTLPGSQRDRRPTIGS